MAILKGEKIQITDLITGEKITFKIPQNNTYPEVASKVSELLALGHDFNYRTLQVIWH